LRGEKPTIKEGKMSWSTYSFYGPQWGEKPKKARKPKPNPEFEALWAKAYEAGMAAGRAVNPTPMVVRTTGPGPAKSWYVPDGLCGFAWVTVRPGNCKFANWAKAKDLMSTAYGGGVQYYVGEFDQSVARKEAFASAAAEVLREAGIRATSSSRLD